MELVAEEREAASAADVQQEVASLGVAVEEHRADEVASETVGEVLHEVELASRLVEDSGVVPILLREVEEDSAEAEDKDHQTSGDRSWRSAVHFMKKKALWSSRYSHRYLGDQHQRRQ